VNIIGISLTPDGKGGKNVKKLAQNRNNFQTHFQYDFSKYRIFPMEYIYPKIREKYELLPMKSVPVFDPQKLKNGIFTQL
jgi:hypothetical protein